MTASYDKSAAIVVLPPVGGGRLRSPKLLSWLARAELMQDDEPRELLERVLHELGKPCPEEGLAALRMWGQTGDRPTAWIAGADPVYLEPRLDHLCLHSLRKTGVPPADMRPLVDHLQSTLGRDKLLGFARVGSYSYVTAQDPMDTATIPAYAIDQQTPGEFLPVGDESAAHRNLTSEVEMALHDHEVNQRRESQGEPPINSLWIWGGGRAPKQSTEPLPPLFTDDPLLRGYWKSKTGVEEGWPGNIAGCLELAVKGFIAVTPEFDDDVDLLEACLFELADVLAAKRVSKLVLLFRDGIRAEVHRSHAMRVWRRQHALLEAPA
ncbi:MAG: hypothetical protein R3358_07245 [Woeseiaceae bacterium]|nr:hypothetical protein [Woeseiaceae bacterium]